MAKLYYRYGAMDSSKTANLLMVAHNYEEQGKKVVIFKPSLDTRSKKGLIESRTGMKHICIDVDKRVDLFSYISTGLKLNNICDAILVDECQFCTKEQIKQLTHIVDQLDIPVICYGLKNSYVDNTLFEGSQALLYYADSIEEIKTVCQYCNKKATMNLRVSNGIPIYSGDTVKIGDVKEADDRYISVCRKHYFAPPITKESGC